MPVSFEARPAPAKATTVSVKAQPAPAKATTVSDNRPSWPTGPGRGARGRRQGQAAAPAGGGGAWPGFETTREHTSATRRRRCGGRRRVRRARAGFEIDHSEPLGSRVAISRAAGPDGARNTRGAASNTINDAGRRPPAHTAAGPSGARNTSGATSNTTAAPTTQRNEAATGCPATASSRSRSAVHNSATSNQAVMST